MSTAQPTLPGVAAPVPVGDPLGRCYTPDALSLACLEAFLADLPSELGPPCQVVDPSVGGGAFIRSAQKLLPEAFLAGVDLDPEAAGLKICHHGIVGDWLVQAALPLWSVFKRTIVVGNPPFDDPPTHWHAREHVLATRHHMPYAALGMILPLGYLGVSGWDDLLTQDTPDLYRIVGRPWPARLREAAFYVWPGTDWGPRRPARIGRINWSG